MKTILVALSLLFCLPALAEKPVKQLWQTGDTFKVPESVLYYPQEEVLFVSNINGHPAQQDNNGFISKLDTKGNVIEMNFVTGLHAPKGMAICNNKLYVSDIFRIAEIDLTTGKILNFYPVEGAQFLNDICADDQGCIYTTGSATNILYRLKDGKVEQWYQQEGVTGLNGLCCHNNNIYLGTNSGIYSVDTATKKAEQVMHNDGSIDGLELIAPGVFVVSDWYGKVHQLSKSGKELLLDLTTEGKNAADMGYIPSHKIIIIPTFSANSVAAYQL